MAKEVQLHQSTESILLAELNALSSRYYDVLHRNTITTVKTIVDLTREGYRNAQGGIDGRSSYYVTFTHYCAIVEHVASRMPFTIELLGDAFAILEQEM